MWRKLAQTSACLSWLRFRVSGIFWCMHWGRHLWTTQPLPTTKQAHLLDHSQLYSTHSRWKKNLFALHSSFSFEIFNCNIHNCLVDSGALANIMLLSIAKKINAQWSKTSMNIIQLNRTCLPAIGELQDVIIRLSHDSRVHHCINIIFVDISEVYGLLLSRD